MKRIFIFFILIISCKEQKNNTENSNISNKISVSIPLIKEINKVTYDFDSNFILGKFNYRKDTTFTKVGEIHSSKTIYIKKEVYGSFIKMFNQAKAENVNLQIISGTRNFYEQKSIWERKWVKYKNLKPLERVKKILEYSSMPSTSRHHWGTDVDLNNLNNSYFEKGSGKKEYDWLVVNANKYGFYQVYNSKKLGRNGYNMEKWHWSYLPLSNQYLSYYNDRISYQEISGFKGSELALELNVIKNYVNGVNKTLKIE